MWMQLLLSALLWGLLGIPAYWIYKIVIEPRELKYLPWVPVILYSLWKEERAGAIIPSLFAWVVVSIIAFLIKLVEFF
jgi:hypothetical protein